MVLPVTGGGSGSGGGSGGSGIEQLFGARVAKLVSDGVDAATAAELRERLRAGGYVRFPYIDRGSYEWRDVAAPGTAMGDEILPGALRAKLWAAAEEASGRNFSGGGGGKAFAGARALRLGAGDYVLDRHDPLGSAGGPGGASGTSSGDADAASVLELMLDLSAAEVEGAEVIYRRNGKPFFQLPSQPGALTIVERDASVSCHHGYLSKRFAGAEVVRLVLRLAL